jgi:hypothetical protein
VREDEETEVMEEVRPSLLRRSGEGVGRNGASEKETLGVLSDPRNAEDVPPPTEEETLPSLA